MTGQNGQRKNINATLIIPTDVPLWDYLVKGTPKADKLSRVQAFYDLIERQHVALLKGEGESLSATMQDLANKWGWNRETVTRFIDNLEQLGTLTVDTTGNRKTVTLNYSTDDKNYTGDFLSPSEPQKPSGASNST